MILTKITICSLKKSRDYRDFATKFTINPNIYLVIVPIVMYILLNDTTLKSFLKKPKYLCEVADNILWLKNELY